MVAVRQMLVGRCEQRQPTMDTAFNIVYLRHESLQRGVRVSLDEICRFKPSFVLRLQGQLVPPTSEFEAAVESTFTFMSTIDD